MALTGWIIFGIIAFLIFTFIRAQRQKAKADAGLYKNQIYLDLKTGYNTDLEMDYNNPSSIVRHDPNSKRDYVLRRAGNFDKGERRIDLEKYMQLDYHGWTLVLNNVNLLKDYIETELVEKETIIKVLENQNSVLLARVKELEEKVEEEFQNRIMFQEKINEAARKGIVFNKRTSGG